MTKKKANRTYWCDTCHVPVLDSYCCNCRKPTRDICSGNLTPVFEEELSYLRSIVTEELHFCLRELELWVQPSRYTYFWKGKAIFRLSSKNENVVYLSDLSELAPAKEKNEDVFELLCSANSDHLSALQYEAEDFVRECVAAYPSKTVLVSFSGGKDSTIVSHLVMSALGRSDVLHMFADTTIELPVTHEYVNEFQRQHPLTPLITVQSKLDFFEVAKSIGSPSRIARWCCTTHKTNPIAKLLTSIGAQKGVLAFDGVRRFESTRRSKYPRVSTQHKITNEILARPVIDWTDIQVWIYLLVKQLPFNKGYSLGFRRVGCLYCPFSSDWSQKMVELRFSDQASKWKNFLQEQAKQMNHPNPEAFVGGGWKVRAGGKGLDHYKTKLESMPCALSEDAVTYQIVCGRLELIREFLRPFGMQVEIAHDDYLESFFIVKEGKSEAIASVEISYTDSAVRINYLVTKYKRLLQQRIEKQLKKLQSCIYCGGCASKCPVDAITVEGQFRIDNERCIGCLKCVSHTCLAINSLKYKRK